MVKSSSGIRYTSTTLRGLTMVALRRWVLPLLGKGSLLVALVVAFNELKRRALQLNSSFLRRMLSFAYGLRPHTHTRVDVIENAPMRADDGCSLMCSVYVPEGAGPNEKRPVILIRTAYSRKILALIAQRFAERGYIAVTQDVRGRFDSAGTFTLLADEKRDGLATLRWMGSQSWYSGGKVGMFGISYLGIVQWAAAAAQLERERAERTAASKGLTLPPIPKLGALVPIMAATNVHSTVCPGKSLSFGFLARWLFFTYYFGGKNVFLLGKIVPREEVRGVAPRTWRWLISSYLQYATMGINLVACDYLLKKGKWATSEKSLNKILLGRDAPLISVPLQPSCSFWQRRDMSAITSDPNMPPCHVIAGWYDFFMPGQLNDYERLQAASGSKHFLTVGPWHHLESIQFGSFRVLVQETLAWFDAHLWPRSSKAGVNAASAPQEWQDIDADDRLMKAKLDEERFARLGTSDDTHWAELGDEVSERGSLHAKRAENECAREAAKFGRLIGVHRLPVKLWVMFGGAHRGEWREFSAWPPPDNSPKAHFLLIDGSLSRLPSATEIEGNRRYVYDPANPTPHRGGPAFHNVYAGCVNQRSVEARDDVLLYTSKVKKSDFEIIGKCSATIYVSIDAPDCSKAPPPASCDIVVRLCDVDEKNRSFNVCEGVARIPVIGSAGDRKVKVTVDMGSTAWRFQKGHRLRVHVCSGAFPRWMRNYGTKSSLDDPLNCDGKMRPAHVTIWSGHRHASSVMLPVVKSGTSDGSMRRTRSAGMVVSKSAHELRHSTTATIAKSPSTATLGFLERVINSGMFNDLVPKHGI